MHKNKTTIFFPIKKLIIERSTEENGMVQGDLEALGVFA